MMHPNDPYLKAQAKAAAEQQWHGKCFLYDDKLQLRFEVALAAASAPTRVVTTREVDPNDWTIWDPDGNPVGPTPEVQYDTWLLVGNPVKIPEAMNWSAIYTLEMEDV